MNKSFKTPKVSVKALYPSAALKHGHNETLQMRLRHNNRITRAGGRYTKLSRNTERRIDQYIENERKRKTRKLKSLMEERDNLNDENPEERDMIRDNLDKKINQLLKGGKKKKKNTRKHKKKKGGSKSCGCGGTPSTVVSYPAGSSSSMSPNPNGNIQSGQQQFADSACVSTGDVMGDSWSQTGGSDLGKFIENLNNMSGGKRKNKRKKKNKKSKKKKRTHKKNRKTKKIRLSRRK